MSEVFLLKNHNGASKKIPMASYIAMSSLPVLIAIFIMLAGLHYFNNNGGYYNQDDILKLAKMFFVSAFFSIVWSISTIYMDKVRIKKIIYKFKHKFNEINSTGDLKPMKNINNEILRDISEEIKKRRSLYGELKGLEIQTLSFKVKGINVKTVECSVSCIMLFSLEQSENIIFNFHSINNGDLKLQNIVFTIDSEPS